ncbi:helix-turn-helix domain-containing protein [Aurantibacter sp.]|uniref:helix-turn-helix domain-containing protein n=1 Tax=Aurantibacter sp. TaxID=2807103 RepID=UPI00326467F7
MDKRLLDYLKQKSILTNNSTLKLTHGQIANDLGTAREVISRVIKKLEQGGALIQNNDGIVLLDDM